MPPQENPITHHRSFTLGIIVALILVLAGALLWEHRSSPYIAQFLGTNTKTSSNVVLLNTATYTCDNGKTIQASFYDTAGPQPQMQPGQPPIPTGSVSLILSDGRTLALPQTISGSGIRYANSDESIIFWSKGNTAFIEEGPSQQETYQGCVTAAQPQGASSSTSPEEGVLPTQQ